jgi:hypothetical protein
MVAFRAERDHEQNGRLLRETEQLLEQENRRRIAPVQVLDADDERRLLGNPGEQLADDLERPPLKRFRRELRGARGGIALERQVEQRSEVRVELVGLPEQLLQGTMRRVVDEHAARLRR